jgi:hypothetical protein
MEVGRMKIAEIRRPQLKDGSGWRFGGDVDVENSAAKVAPVARSAARC